MSAQTELDLSPRGRVLDGVCYEIQEKLAQPRPVPQHYRIGGKKKVDGHAPRFAKNERGLVHFLEERLHLDRLPVQVKSPLVRARQGEQTLDQIAHPSYLLERLLQGNHFFRLRRGVHHRPLDVGAQNCQWCLELVTGVRRESTESAE